MPSGKRSWRATKRVGPKGIYWSLRAGRGRERVAISLGYVSADEVEAACQQMQIEEDNARSEALIQWHASHRDDAIRYLVGDPVARMLYKPRPDYRTMKLGAYFEEVYKDWRAQARPGGWKQEERVWRRILGEIGGTQLRDVDAHLVADYLDGLVAQSGPRKGQQASGATRRLHRAAIQALLKRAYRLKHLKELPKLAVFEIEGATKRAIEKPAPLDLEELGKLMEVSEPRFRAMWAVAAGQGLRPSELNRIRWEDVDLSAKTLRVRGTKTAAADATVPLTPLALRELRDWWLRKGQPAEGLAFPAKSGEAYGDQGWKKALKNAAAAAGIERRVYPYLLRDSFATISWLQGIPLDIARRVMRHTVSSRVLEEVYCRPRPADVAAKLGSFDQKRP